MEFPGIDRIFQIKNNAEFEELALSVFRYQAEENEVYKSFIKFLKINPVSIKLISSIPFLPIEFFKTQQVICGQKEPEIIFTSSGTTGQNQSRHFVKDLNIYEKSFKEGFKYFYGDIEDYVILALLPSYLERNGSSLIYMVEELIKETNNKNSGFYLKNYKELVEKIRTLRGSGKKILVLGVTFALLELAEQYPSDFSGVIIMETGGMKGQRKEITREELHKTLTQSLNVETIHSEYGMTELLSQAYSTGNGVFECPPWMRVSTRDPYDPFNILETGKVGGMNIIDLANVNSCSFIATQDLGIVQDKNTFEITGRFDNSDIRGCNLLIA